MSPKRGISLGDWKNTYGGRFNDEGTLQLSIPGVQGPSGVTTGVSTIDRVLYHPFVVDHPIQVDQLTITVTSAGAGSTTARMGIYHADNEFQPLSLVVDAGTVAVDSTGVKHLAVSPAELLLPGRYVMALNTDGTPTLRLIAVGIMMLGGLDESFGTNPFVAELFATQTYAAFPDPGTQYTTAGITNNGFWYRMLLRVSAL